MAYGAVSQLSKNYKSVEEMSLVKLNAYLSGIVPILGCDPAFHAKLIEPR